MGKRRQHRWTAGYARMLLDDWKRSGESRHRVRTATKKEGTCAVGSRARQAHCEHDERVRPGSVVPPAEPRTLWSTAS